MCMHCSKCILNVPHTLYTLVVVSMSSIIPGYVKCLLLSVCVSPIMPAEGERGQSCNSVTLSVHALIQLASMASVH